MVHSPVRFCSAHARPAPGTRAPIRPCHETVQVIHPMEISKRAQINASKIVYLGEGFRRWATNKFHKDNPSGIVNLGTAENKLHQTKILERLNSIQLKLEPSALGYANVAGSVELRSIVANILVRHLHIQLKPEEIVMVAGTGAAISAIAQVIADVGDYMLIPCPAYGGFWPDLGNQAAVNIQPIDLDPSQNFKWDLNLAKDALALAKKLGRHVSALLLCSPNNPFGTCYSRQELINLLDWCEAEGLHLISDEIYALSDFGNQFHSIYSIPISENMKNRVHILWGMSKDFCVNGLRIGACISRSENVVNALNAIGFFHNINSVTDVLLQRYLGDEVWVDEFISNNNSMLKDMYKLTQHRLDKMGVPFLPATAGFFVWMDLRKWIVKLGGKPFDPTVYHSEDEIDYSTEMILWERLLDAGVYIALGRAFECRDPGWFRMLFVPESTEVMNMCLDRIQSVLDAI
jgi:aspartate/methionine/tyrosine aminotransferase